MNQGSLVGGTLFRSLTESDRELRCVSSMAQVLNEHIGRYNGQDLQQY